MEPYESSAFVDNPSPTYGDLGWEGFAPTNLLQLNPGDLIGKCRILRPLGQGGMGAVYLAKHTVLDLEVALKVVSPALVRDNPALAQRFVREAQVAAKIRHPNVVAVMDADTDMETGLAYLVLEYLPGGSVADVLKEGPLPEMKALRILGEIAEALRVAAENNIAHRDIKPGNLMFAADGQAKLADLGLARLLNTPSVNVTQDGAAIGTPAYMSPQHIRDARTADSQDDLYSLGATFYEMLTGRPPFAGETPYNVISEILSQPTPDPKKINPKVSPGASALCQKLMAKEKVNRYANASAVLRDVRALQRGETPSALVGPGKVIRRVEQRTGLESGTSLKDRAFLLGSMAFCLLVVYSFWPERNKPLVMPTLGGVIESMPPMVETETHPEIRKAQPVSPLWPNSGAVLPQENSPVVPLTSVAIELPTPTVPPAPLPGSLKEVRQVAESVLAPEVRGQLIQAFGLRTPGQALPESWRLFYFDKSARQHVRSVTVEALHLKEVVDGFVELRKLRVTAYKPSEVIDSSRVLLDSPQALDALMIREELHGIAVAESAFELNAVKREQAPFWRITLFARENSDVLELGSARVSAETGEILDFNFDSSRLDRVRLKAEPAARP